MDLVKVRFFVSVVLLKMHTILYHRRQYLCPELFAEPGSVVLKFVT